MSVINIEINNSTLTINWPIVKNSYDETYIIYNDKIVRNFYTKTINNSTFNGFYLSYGPFKFTSNNGKITGRLDSHGAFKTQFNRETQFILRNKEGYIPFDCGTVNPNDLTVPYLFKPCKEDGSANINLTITIDALLSDGWVTKNEGVIINDKCYIPLGPGTERGGFLVKNSDFINCNDSKCNTVPTTTPTPTKTSISNTPTPSVTPTETSCFEYLTDDNGNYITDDNSNLIILKELCVSPTPTPTNTPTPTVTPTVTPSITPSVTASPIPVTGYGYNLVATPYEIPTSGNTIISNGNAGDISGSTDPNSFNNGPQTDGIYWNKIDKDGVDRDSYYSSFVGNCVRLTISQNGSTAIYDGTLEDVSGLGAPYGGWTGITEGTGYYFRGDGGNQIQLIQSATTEWVIGDTVYISLRTVRCPTPTPTPSISPI